MTDRNGSLGCKMSRSATLLGVTLFASLLAGCADSLPSLPKLADINPFAEKQVPLAGKRVAILAEGNKVGGELASADRPISSSASKRFNSGLSRSRTPIN